MVNFETLLTQFLRRRDRKYKKRFSKLIIASEITREQMTHQLLKSRRLNRNITETLAGSQGFFQCNPQSIRQVSWVKIMLIFSND